MTGEGRQFWLRMLLVAGVGLVALLLAWTGALLRNAGGAPPTAVPVALMLALLLWVLTVLLVLAWFRLRPEARPAEDGGLAESASAAWAQRGARIGEAAPIALLEIDEQGIVQTANRYAAQLFGCAAESLAGRLVADFLETMEPDGTASPIGHALPLFSGMHWARQVDGRRVPVELGLSMLEAGGQSRTLLALSDQSSSYAARQSELRQRELLQLVLDRLELEVAVFNLDAGPEYLNRAWVEAARRRGGGAANAPTRFPDVLAEAAWSPDPVRLASLQSELSALREGRRNMVWTEYRLAAAPDVWLRLRAVVLDLADQALLMVAFEDVSERHRLDRQLRERTAQVQQVLQHAPVAIAAVDRDLKPVLFSWRWCREFCVEPDAVSACSLAETEWFPEAWVGAARRSLAGETVVGREDLYLRAGGEPAWYQWVMRPWPGEDGQPAGVLMAFEPVTETRNALEAYRNAEQKLRALFEQSRQPLFLLDVDGVLRRCNGVLPALLGVSSEELLGEPFWRMPWWGGERSRMQEARRAIEAAAQGRDMQVEAEVLAPDGHTRVFDLVFSPLEDQGQPIMLIVAGHDVTAQREARVAAEEARRQSEAAARVRSGFLANMSHELRTPLNAVIGFSDLLADHSLGKLGERQRDYVQFIHEAGLQLLELIDEILDLARFEAGRVSLALTRWDLLELVRSVLQLVDHRASDAAVQISLDATMPERLRSLVLDPQKIRRTLVILLSNAIKFTPPGGLVELRLDADDERVRILVRDTGVGISGGDLERIFEHFVQVESPLVKQQPGSGLGLPLARQFIRMHHGEIWAESGGVGQGSTFVIHLPYLDPETGMPEGTAGAPSGSGSGAGTERSGRHDDD